MQNPYRGYGRPVAGVDFIGRTGIVEDIADCLMTGNVFLTGLHRVGKSSVAERVRVRLIEKGSPVCAAINLNTIKTEYDLLRHMLIALKSPSARTLSDEDGFIALVEAQEAMEESFRKRAAPIVMIIDEFDGILAFDEPVQTINRLREIAYYPSRYGINFLFISSRSLNAIETKVAGSNLSGICANKFLVPFDLAETSEFVGKCGIVDDDGFVQAVYSQTGGIPYLAAALMSEFCDRCEDPEAEESRLAVLNDSVSGSSRIFHEYYEKIRRMLSDEDRAWGELIGMVIGPMMKGADPILANLFREYGLIREDGSCVSEHFEDYLEMCARDVAPFETLRSVEVGLRGIVNTILSDKYGPDWAKSVCEALPSVALGLERAKEKLEKQARKFRLAKVSDLIEFTDMGDIKGIVSSAKYWPLFQASIGMGLNEFKGHMDRIIPMRNNTMHHRSPRLVPPEQVAAARESCEALLRKIR